MAFQNSAVGGVTLVRPAVQSPNFVTGSTGWAINRDGSAEFNNVVIRGSTTTQGTLLFYSGTPAAGNLVMAISRSGGTDSFGNTYHAGVEVLNGAGTSVDINTAQVNFYHPSYTVPGFFEVTTSQGILEVAPRNSSGGTHDLIAQMNLVAGNSDGSADPQLKLQADLNLQAFFGTANDLVTINAASGHTGNLLRVENNTTDEFVVDASGNTSTTGNANVTGNTVVTGTLSTSAAKFVNDTNGVLTTYANNAFTTYTPTVSGGGTATFTTRTGWYQRVGKMVMFNAYVVINAGGSGAANVTIDAPTSIERTDRQSILVTCEGLTAGNNGSCALVAFTGGSGATFDRLRNSTGANITGADLSAGALITVNGWYREA